MTIEVPSKNYRGRKSDLPRQNLGSLGKYRGKIEYTEAEFKYPRKITEAEFWLMLHPDMITFINQFTDGISFFNKNRISFILENYSGSWILVLGSVERVT